jgi:DNA transformation protein and related proteins
MAVTPSVKAFVLEQLGRVLPTVRGRGMFGGVGIYAGDLFFALIAEDTLYFKVDDTNRTDFESLGMGPFRPYGLEGEVMQYYRVPDDLLDDMETLGDWARKSVEVARRARDHRSGRGPA